MSTGCMLKLGREWELGNQLNKGGFGTVFEAKSVNMPPAVAKLVPKAPGADRELLFENPIGVPNVVPIIDKGETRDSWVLIMPRADKSLQQHLADAGAPLQAADAVPILVDIAKALAALDGKIVHRDLKPGNVLLLDGHWCLADFGISRYAEASTALDTKKFAMSPPYAAPERWRAERATSATDVYSLGVIAFQLLTGRLPYPGPDVTDYRDQHLHGKTPTDGSIPAPLAALIDECLFKAPGARPSPANVLARLERLEVAPRSPAAAKLRAVNAAVIRGRSESERQASVHLTEAERRKDLFYCAVPQLTKVWDRLISVIKDAAPAVTMLTSLVKQNHGVELGQAQLALALPTQTSAEPWNRAEHPVFNVVAQAAVILTIPRGRNGYEGRSHSLWYCDAQEAGRYQWFETAFMINPLVPRGRPWDPFALDPGEASAMALAPGMAEYQPAWPFTPLTTDNIEEFINRWVDWFATAAQGQLRHPDRMPEREPHGSWRRK